MTATATYTNNLTVPFVPADAGQTAARFATHSDDPIPGYRGATEAEVQWCLKARSHFDRVSRLTRCGISFGLARWVGSIAERYFPDGTPDAGILQDAFRHCLWSALMTIVLGPAEAKAFTDRHERGSDNTPAEGAKDQFNNAIGRVVGASNDPFTGYERGGFSGARDGCRRLAIHGGLALRPNDPRIGRSRC